MTMVKVYQSWLVEGAGKSILHLSRAASALTCIYPGVVHSLLPDPISLRAYQIPTAPSRSFQVACRCNGWEFKLTTHLHPANSQVELIRKHPVGNRVKI